MDISINPSLLNINDQYKFGIIHYTKIIVSESPQMVKGRLRLFQENLYFELQESSVTTRPGIREWRKLWKTLGADPNRYRHSSESLMRRIAKQNFLPSVHSAVDLNNFFSLQYEIPVGIYDVHKIKGDIKIDLGDETIGYEGLNGRYNSLKNILYSKDEEGAFGSPFVDSIRTATTNATTDALQIFYLRPSLSEEECEQLLTASGKMFQQIHGGDYKTGVLSKEHTTLSI